MIDAIFELIIGLIVAGIFIGIVWFIAAVVFGFIAEMIGGD